MRGFGFNHVFALLLMCCATSAFVLPRYVDPARAQVQNIYAPVSHPAFLLIQLIQARLSHSTRDPISPDSPRADADIRQENLELHQELASLSVQLQKLQEREAQHAQLGRLRDLCTPYSVAAGDSGTSETLLIAGTSLDGLRAKTPALYPGGLAGWLLTPGLTGTRVRLITDRGFSVIGAFARFVKRADNRVEFVRLSIDPPPLVRGEGNNSLLIEDMPLAATQNIHVNDWVLLDDPDWPAAVQGQPLGRVVGPPSPLGRSPGFAQIRLAPAAKLMQLRELMIVDKAK
jgi:hypothetical protein